MNFQSLNELDGLQFIPVDERKMPTVSGWQTTAKKYDLSKAKGVGLVCGKLSGGVEAIDIDLKYDLTGKLFDRYKRLIHEMDSTLLAKLLVQRTKSGGYHFIYRCSVVAGNAKLANRPSTPEEKQETYLREYNAAKEAGLDEETAKKQAESRAKNDKVKVLIETRGEGGQIVCFPSKGYEIIHNDFYSIPEITPEQREILMNIARQFNEVFEEHRPVRQEVKKQKGLSPFEDYNERGDIIGLLESHGWKVVGSKGGKTLFLRPGQTTAAHSGNYDDQRGWFSVFTTSSEFEPQKAYRPYAVYAILECGGNFSEASKKLYAAGFGDRMEKQQEINQTTPSRISLIDDDYSFLTKPSKYSEYLEQARRGTLPMGKTTGIQSLDKHFLFKEGAFVIINGFDNVGKTSVIIFLCLLSAMYHGWCWIMLCAENSTGSCMRKLIEFYWNKPIKKMNDLEYQQALRFAETHFAFIETEDELFNYKDVMNMVKKLQNRKKYHAVLIDPYNALKIELTNTSKLSTHEYHYEAISEMKQYTKNTGTAIYINTHAVTSASRLRSDDKKSPMPPQKGDVEGGAKFANKADEFLTIHRDVQHATDWMVTDIYVRKVKETETGGQVTPQNAPVRIRMMKGGCGFTEHNEGIDLVGESPIEVWHRKNQKEQGRITFTPTIPNYQDEDDPF